jgi:hypothetical protein
MRTHLTLYPDLPGQRRSQIVRDLLVVLLIAFFVWCGVKVYDLVAALTVLGEGVREAGSTVEGGFTSVADAVGGIPLVGDALAGAFTSVGDGTGGNVADLGQAGVDAVYLLARTLGILTAALPISVLLVAVVPRRVRTIREMSAAREVSDFDVTDPERRKLLAMRAAFGLPFRELMPYTRDPFGDLAEGRYDALVAAALADVGLRHRPSTGRAA